MSRTCNEKCLCFTCSKSCKRACEKCNPVFKMGVRSCAAYTSECVSECTQLNLNNFMNGIGELPTEPKENEM